MFGMEQSSSQKNNHYLIKAMEKAASEEREREKRK